MHVMQMFFVIPIVANLVLPKPALPNAPAAVTMAREAWIRRAAAPPIASGTRPKAAAAMSVFGSDWTFGNSLPFSPFTLCLSGAKAGKK